MKRFAEKLCFWQPSLSERVVVDGLGCHTALDSGVKAKENQDRVPTSYWLIEHHKTHIKQDSTCCTITELKIANFMPYSYLKHVIKYWEKIYERSCKNLF